MPRFKAVQISAHEEPSALSLSKCLPPAAGELVSVAFGLERKEQARKAARARWGRKEIA